MCLVRCTEKEILSGSELQTPPHAAVMTFGFPAESYVPMMRMGVGMIAGFLPMDNFIITYGMVIYKTDTMIKSELISIGSSDSFSGTYYETKTR